MLVDVFVKVYAPNMLRLGMAITAIERWNMEEKKGTCKLWLLGAEGTMSLPNWHFLKVFPLDVFHIEAKRYAEAHAESEIYVVADDDQLIVNRDFLHEGLRVMDMDHWSNRPPYKKWGMLAGWMVTGEVPDGSGGLEAWQSGSIGCPYFIRKGILTDMPQGNLSSYDTLLTEHVMSKGYKTGFLRHSRYNHLGYGYSEVGKALNNPVAWQA